MTLEIKIQERIGVIIKSTVAKIKAAVVFVVENTRKMIGAVSKGSETVTGPPAKVKRKKKIKQV